MNNWRNYLQHLKFHKLQECRYKNTRIDNTKVYNSILEVIGNTPLVKLNRIPKDHGLECEIYAKCEYFNPAGSIKDRVGYNMMQDAISHGKINDNSIFLEPTSGNTGIAIVFNATLKGHKSVLVLSEKDSDEKVDTMRLLGADVIQIKENMSDIDIAEKIKDSDPNTYIMLQQFDNDMNPMTHFEYTGKEIHEALGPVDMTVMGVGTGGTITGVSYKLKEHNPNCIVVAAEPEGSVVFNVHGESHSFLVEGVTGTEVPIVLDKSIVDTYEVVTDEEAFLMARELCKKEGLLCGGSGGLIVAAAVKAAKRLKLKAHQKVAVVLPDSIRNYMTKFVRDQWMEAYRFIEPPTHDFRWWNEPVTVLNNRFLKLETPLTCEDALNLMNKEGVSIAVVVDRKGNYVGVVSKDSWRNYATNPTKFPGKRIEKFCFKDNIIKYMVKHVYKLALNDKKGMPTVGLLSRVLDITPHVVVGKQVDKDHFVPSGLHTAETVLDHIHNFTEC